MRPSASCESSTTTTLPIFEIFSLVSVVISTKLKYAAQKWDAVRIPEELASLVSSF